MPPTDPIKKTGTGVSAHTATPKPSTTTEDIAKEDRKDDALRDEGMEARDAANLTKESPDKQRAVLSPEDQKIAEQQTKTYGTRAPAPAFRVPDPIRAERHAQRAFDPKSDPQHESKLAAAPPQQVVSEKNVVQQPAKTGEQVTTERPYIARENVPAGTRPLPAGTHPSSEEKPENERPVRKVG